MYWSNLFFNNKNFSKNNSLLSDIDLMNKAGVFHQNSSGIYSFLSIGNILLDSLESLISKELQSIGFSKIRLSILQDLSLWKKSGRDKSYNQDLFSITSRNSKHYVLSATCEELISSITKDLYTDSFMNIKVFQIESKFRDELRSKNALIRSKEFLMKDAYSIHSNIEDLTVTYNKIKQSYLKLFESLGLNILVLEADNGEMGGSFSEEFYCESKFGDFEHNNKKYLEIAHIFNLDSFYSSQFNITDNKKNKTYMGCYGIGISRLLMVLLENQRNIKGFFGTQVFKSFNFNISLVDNQLINHEITKEICTLISSVNKSYIIDDRQVSIGKKLSDSELILAQYRIVISQNTITNNIIEVTNLKTMKTDFLHLSQILSL